MKIKRIFGLASILSLGFLMFGCKKTNGKPKDVYKQKGVLEALSTSEEKLSKLKTRLKILVDEYEELVSNDQKGHIVIKTSEGYEFFDLAISNSPVLKLDTTDYASSSFKELSGGGNLLYVNGVKDADGKYALSVYAYEKNSVKQILPNEIVNDTTYLSSLSSLFYKLEDGKLANNTRFALEYTTDEGNQKVYFNVFNKVEGFNLLSEGESSYEYLTDEELKAYDKYATTSIDVDAKFLGLKGYEVDYLQAVNEKIVIKKDGKIVNIINNIDDACCGSKIISDGKVLYQTYEVVDESNYDCFFNGSYYKVYTYTYDLLTNKVAKINNFKYVMETGSTNAIIVDDAIYAYNVTAYDYTKKKDLSSADAKEIIVKGNGEFYEGLDYDSIVKVDTKYYCYKDGYTRVLDENGKEVDFFLGRYVSGVIVEIDKNNNVKFYSASTKKFIAYAESYSSIAYDKGIGSVAGKGQIITISNGNVTFTECDYKFDSLLQVFYMVDDSDNTCYFYNVDGTELYEFNSALNTVTSYGYRNIYYTYKGNQYLYCIDIDGIYTMFTFE